MKNIKCKSILTITILSGLLTACGYGSNTSPSQSPNTNNAQAIIPPSITVITQAHATGSAYYNNKTNNTYYQAITVTNKSARAVTIGTLSLAGANPTEFKVESNASLYPATQTICTNNMNLAGNQTCEIIVSLTNTNDMSTTQKTATLNIPASGVQYSKILTKNSYAYVGGSFSQVYANASRNIPAISPSGTGSCGQGNSCLLLKYNMANNQVSNVANTDYMVNTMTLGNNGTLYFAGQFTDAKSGASDLTLPSGYSFIVGMNPAISGAINDVIANSGVNQYPNDQIYSMAFNNNYLYVTGGFTQMAGVGDGSGIPIVSFNTESTGQTAWQNTLNNDANDPDLSVSAIGFNNNIMYISGTYSRIDGNQYVPASSDYGNFVMNACTTLNNGQTYSCDATNFVNVDAVNTTPGSYIQGITSIKFDNSGNMYTAGGFHKIGGFGVDIESDFIIATSSIFNPLNTATFTPSFLDPNYPDELIGFVSPYNVNKFVTGGFFSTIGGVAADSNPGMCGPGASSYAGTNSCLFAQYDGSNFSKIFTTDGWINAVVYSNEISSN